MKTQCLFSQSSESLLRSVWAGTLSLMLFAIPQVQAVTSDQWKQFNLNTVDHYVIPGYQALSKESEQLLQASKALCAKPDKPTEALQNARTAFHNTMDAWQRI